MNKKIGHFLVALFKYSFMFLVLMRNSGKPGFCVSKNVPIHTRNYHDCALEWEWNYIKNKMNIDEFDVDDVLIYREDGFWYVEK